MRPGGRLRFLFESKKKEPHAPQIGEERLETGNVGRATSSINWRK